MSEVDAYALIVPPDFVIKDNVACSPPLNPINSSCKTIMLNGCRIFFFEFTDNNALGRRFRNLISREERAKLSQELLFHEECRTDKIMSVGLMKVPIDNFLHTVETQIRLRQRPADGRIEIRLQDSMDQRADLALIDFVDNLVFFQKPENVGIIKSQRASQVRVEGGCCELELAEMLNDCGLFLNRSRPRR